MEVQTINLRTLKCYDHLLTTTADINLLWGGRDSGKSYFIAQKLIVDCLSKEYFRCILIKKTHESIKDAQWQLIKDIITESGMSDMFTFLRSPLEIHCRENDNKFIARGCDNAEKLKSIANPSTVWIEEGNQLTQEDYLTISTSLRTNVGTVQEWLSFNPETKGDYNEHWIYRDFFKGIHETTFTKTKTLTVNEEEYPLTYTSTHTTYKDNEFCKPEQIARHENLQQVNPHRYRVFTVGLWGNEDNTNPWAWALNRKKHYTPTPYEVNKNYVIDISFDFNHDPCVCIVGQVQLHIPRYSIISYYRASSSHESAIKQLCDRIRTEYPHHYQTRQMIITGDASGKQRDANRPTNLNRFSDIIHHLGLGEQSVKVERGNASHKASRDLCNDTLHIIPQGGYLFHGGKGCEMLLSEIESAYPDDKESLNRFKKDAGGHGLDAWRYLNQYWFAHRLTGSRFKEYKEKLNGIEMRLKNTIFT